MERLQAFRPPFCPWPSCPEHSRPSRPFLFRRHGRFSTRRGRCVQRFVCLRCRRSFSSQSFSTSYYLKRPHLLAPVAAALQAGSAHRQIARSLGCAPSTVTRLSARLGRHAMLLHSHALFHLDVSCSESFALDHFEAFEFSQDLPFGVATAVGSRSWFLYALEPAPHAPGGPLSAPRKERLLLRPQRARHGGYLGSTRRVFERLLALPPATHRVTILCDEHPAYLRAAALHPQRHRLHLRRFRNPPRRPKGSAPSPEGLARNRALFPCDALHQLLRHSVAHYRRETIAFPRRLNAAMERLYLTAVWRNFLKGRSERRPDRTTPAMRLGLTGEPWTWRRVLSRRLFPARERLSPLERLLYTRGWLTPALPTNQLHQLRHAY